MKVRSLDCLVGRKGLQLCSSTSQHALPTNLRLHLSLLLLYKSIYLVSMLRKVLEFFPVVHASFKSSTLFTHFNCCLQPRVCSSSTTPLPQPLSPLSTADTFRPPPLPLRPRDGVLFRAGRTACLSR